MTYYIYKLKISAKGRALMDKDPYDFDGVFEMIVSASNDIEARQLAKEREKGGRNRSTEHLWMDYFYIDCTLIGISSLEREVVMVREQHGTG